MLTARFRTLRGLENSPERSGWLSEHPLPVHCLLTAAVSLFGGRLYSWRHIGRIPCGVRLLSVPDEINTPVQSMKLGDSLGHAKLLILAFSR